MITTAQHRKSLTRSEMTAAMFSAAEAGAQVGRIAKAAGVRQKDVMAVVKVKGNEALNGAVAGTAYAWTFDQLAALGDFADDPKALEAIKEAAANEDADAEDVDWAIRIEQTKREKRRKAEAHRAELEKARQRVRDMAELSERATPVWRLRTPDGQRITAEEHADCNGQVWVLEEGDDDQYKPYCTSPALYGHAEPGSPMGRNGKTTAEMEAEKSARAAVKKGNLEWDAAQTRRRQWLADLVKRRNLPKETVNALVGHVNAALLGGGWGLCDDLNKEPTTEILAILLGLTGDKAKDRVGFPEHVAKDPRRAPQLQFAAVAAVREKSASRAAWRTDGQRCDWVRQPTAQWFAILEALGYQLTPIERAVKDGEPYDPHKKQRAAITASAKPVADQAAADAQTAAAA
ncbi:hypothetical protein [Streptomyces sp. G45]|uniref:hypothetical protein n=1 Tax=Streptomyces sp. G45 TaxID=3406627 RepID=UPI003C223C13